MKKRRLLLTLLIIAMIIPTSYINAKKVRLRFTNCKDEIVLYPGKSKVIKTNFKIKSIKNFFPKRIKVKKLSSKSFRVIVPKSKKYIGYLGTVDVAGKGDEPINLTIHINHDPNEIKNKVKMAVKDCKAHLLNSTPQGASIKDGTDIGGGIKLKYVSSKIPNIETDYGYSSKALYNAKENIVYMPNDYIHIHKGKTIKLPCKSITSPTNTNINSSENQDQQPNTDTEYVYKKQPDRKRVLLDEAEEIIKAIILYHAPAHLLNEINVRKKIKINHVFIQNIIKKLTFVTNCDKSSNKVKVKNKDLPNHKYSYSYTAIWKFTITYKNVSDNTIKTKNFGSTYTESGTYQFLFN